MTTLFCVRPVTRNVGNDLINRAVLDLVALAFEDDVSVVNIPALSSGTHGGFVSAQVYDMNRLADGVLIGGGNLFENGQLSFDPQAFAALRKPLMLIGLSHGRIHDERDGWVARTDSMSSDTIRRLVGRAGVALVRDHASKSLLDDMGAGEVEVGGCPSMLMAPNPPGQSSDGRILLSIRHPAQMSVSPELQWRTPGDVRRLINALRGAYGDEVHLICHDYKDLEFAAGFADVPRLYFDDVERYIQALRSCRLSVSYRLHAFLPCLAFGVPSIHLSYDERGAAMVACAGMADWDIDLMATNDVATAVMARASALDDYHRLRSTAAASLERMRTVTMAGLVRFAAAVAEGRR